MAIQLRDDEHIVHRSRISYVILFEVPIIILIGLLVTLIFTTDGIVFSTGWLLFIVLDAVKVGLHYRRTQVVVTNQRLLAKHGAFFADEIAIELNDLSSVIVSQDYLGRWFNYGEITINTKAGRYHAITKIYQPAKLQQAIDQVR